MPESRDADLSERRQDLPAVDTTLEEQKAVRGTTVGGKLSLKHIGAWRG